MLKADDGDGHYWEPVLTDGHINLHIFSAEDHFHKPSNAEEDFNKCVDLLGGLNLRLQTRSLRATGILDARHCRKEWMTGRPRVWHAVPSVWPVLGAWCYRKAAMPMWPGMGMTPLTAIRKRAPGPYVELTLRTIIRG